MQFSTFHPDFPPATGRVCFLKAHLETPEVQDLVPLLIRISADGVMEYEEMSELANWLNRHTKSEIPGIQYLFSIMLKISADGQLTNDEIFELQLAIERVLPKKFRDRISLRRQEAFYDQPASDRQVSFLTELIHSVPVGITRREASALITRYTENPPASNRQVMFLRFWGRPDLVTHSRHAVSSWMDGFISEDYGRMLAWNLFKEESGDDGQQGDPQRVPVGIAEDYYARAMREFGK